MTAALAEYTGAALQMLLGAVFLVAAVGKLRNPARFEGALRGYELVPSMLSGPVAGGLVASEAFVGISLLSGLALPVGVPVAGGLLLIFALAVGINLRRGRDVPCGCFGSEAERISIRTLARLGMLILAVVVFAVVRFVADPIPLDVGSLVADGTIGLERLMFTAALAAFLALLAAWALHLPEMRVLIRRPLE
jgi:hypothetical protein